MWPGHWSGLPRLEGLRATVTWLHDVEGLAPNQMQLFTKGSKRMRLVLDAELGHGVAARLCGSCSSTGTPFEMASGATRP